jgi:hypothetical protein
MAVCRAFAASGGLFFGSDLRKYSTLVLFFADLVGEGKLDLKNLRGLSEEKLLYIRHYAEQSAA